MPPALKVYVVIALVALTVTNCAANPVVGFQTRICPAYDVAPGSQDSVEIAASPVGYLAVWRDSRGGQSDIFGCRLNASGQVIDQAAIAICQQTTYEQNDPSVAWNGSQYLVVWGDRREGPQHIYCARVLSDGTVIDPQGRCISGSSGTQAYPRVASDGQGWLIVWQDSRGGTQDIYGCKMNGDGSVNRVSGIVTLANNNEETPDVAFNGATYIVTWRDYRNIASTDGDIYNCRVALNGVRMAGDTLVSCNAAGTAGVVGLQSSPRICACGSTSMVVWEDYRGDGVSCDIYGTRLNSSGAVLDKNGIAIATGADDQELPAVAYDGSKLLVAWREHSTRCVRGTRMTTAGGVLDPGGRDITTGAAGANGIALCADLSSGFWVGWNDLSIGGNHVLTTWVPNTGTFAAAAGSYISLGQENQQRYWVADSGTEYVAVWDQDVSGKHCILGARVSYAGEVLTPTPVNITGAIPGQQSQPSIAWNGTEYLVAWCGDESFATTDLDIRALRLTAALAPKEVNPILVCTSANAQMMPFVTSNGNSFLVAWEDSRNAISPNYFTDIYGALVSSAGAVTALSGAVSMSYGNQLNPRLASNGTDYYAVWEDYRTGMALIYGAKVTSAGAVSPAAGTLMPATSTWQTVPSICYGGGNYLVTWSDGYRISGCRINSSGAIQDPSGISIENGSVQKGRPAVTWDGSKYQIVWEDYRSAFPGNADLYYTTMSAGGVVSTDPQTALVSDLTPQVMPWILGNASAGVLFHARVENYINSLCVASLSQQGLFEVATIRAAKECASGSLVSVRGKIVTALTSNGFHIEEPDRTSGIKVISAAAVQVGEIVDVVGVVGACDGERQITTGTVTAMGVAGEPIQPFAMQGDSIGGGALSPSIPGITGGRGAHNIGLLVKTWGTVSSVSTGCFCINSSPGTTIKVKSGTLLQPSVGDVVSVVGVSTCDVVGGAICRAILPRTQADIVIGKHTP